MKRISRKAIFTNPFLFRHILLPRLSEEGFLKIAQYFSSKRKDFLVYLLDSSHISKFPDIFLKSVKAFCSLRTPPYPRKVYIPDEILLNLNQEEISSLLDKCFHPKGFFVGLRFNVKFALERMARTKENQE